MITLILTNTTLRTPFSLPRIDEVVDSTAGCELLSFLDCYSGYHQISLKKEDQIVGVLTPIPLRLGLGRPEPGGPSH